MKNQFLALIAMITLAGCQQEKQQATSLSVKLPDFKPHGKAYVHFINEAQDSVEIERLYPALYGTTTRVPDIKSVKLKATKDTLLIYDIPIPQVYTIAIQRDNQELYLYYDDTLTVRIKKIHKSLKHEKIKHYGSENSTTALEFEGKYALENYYITQKSKRFNPMVFARIANNSSVSLEKFAASTDSLMHLEFRFLDSMNQVAQLSELFYQTEKAAISYKALESKIKQPGFREFQIGSVVKTSDDYYDFMKEMEMGNPYGRYTFYYPFFLSNVAYHNYVRSWNMKIPGFIDLIRAKQDSAMFSFITDSLNITESAHRDSLFSIAKRQTWFNEIDKLKPLVGQENFNLFLISQAQIEIGHSDYQEARIALLHYKSEFSDNPYLAVLDNEFEPKENLKDGVQAPYFYLETPEEKFLSIQDYQGKLLLLNFWAPWCKPCLAQLPDEKKLATKYGSEPFEIINICIQCKKTNWLKTIKEKSMPGQHLFAADEWPKKLNNSYKINGIPHYTLVSANGRIISNNTFRPSDPRLDRLIGSNLQPLSDSSLK